MRKLKFLQPTLAMVSMALALGLTSLAETAVAAPAQTAQGIMVNLDASGTFALVNNKFYEFNVTTAATYFSNDWDGSSPTVNCTGSSAACSNPAPLAPPAPAPDASKVTGPTGVAQAQKCTFLDGGTLTGSTYTQSTSITVGTGPNRRAYTYTYTYNVTPTTNPVGAFTAWDFIRETGSNTAQIDINAEIASESVVKNSNPSIGTKYSFSLRNSDGSSRVTDLKLTVDGVDYFPGHTLMENCPGCLAGDLGAVDFAYATNAGSNGVTSLLTNGDARTILNGDTFAGNNNGGADGTALAKAVMDTVGVDLGVSDHTVTLTGTVKGNNALANISFAVTQTIHIIGPGCGGS